jgi:hypothetical protein
MSLNHIINTSVQDDEALSVKFNDVFCQNITVAGGLGEGSLKRYIFDNVGTSAVNVIQPATATEPIGLIIVDQEFVYLQYLYSAGGNATVSMMKNATSVTPFEITLTGTAQTVNTGVNLQTLGDNCEILISHNSDENFSPYKMTLQITGSKMNAIITRYNIVATALP